MALSANKKKEIIERVKSYIREGSSHCTKVHARVKENGDFERGHQWSKGDSERQARRERPAIPQNSILKTVNAIANREMVNRFEPRTYGRSQSDNGIAQVLDASCKWQRDQSETEHEESMAFRSAVASGLGVMHKWFDGGVWGGEGQVKDEEVPVWSMLWPLRARKMNLVDRRWHVHGKIITMAEAEYSFGHIREAKALLNKMNAQRRSYSMKTFDDGSRPANAFSSFSWEEIRDGSWYNLAEEQVFVVEAEWIDTKKIWRIARPVLIDDVYALSIGEVPSIQWTDPNQQPDETGQQPQPVEVTVDMLSQVDANGTPFIKQLLQETELEVLQTRQEFNTFTEMYTALTGEEFEDYNDPQTEIVMYAITIDEVVIDYGERPYGFTFEFLTGWRHESPTSSEWYGVVDIAKGPQDFKNAILGSMLTVYLSSPKNTMIIAESAVNNVEDFENNFARPIGVTFVKDEFFSEPPKYLQLDAPSFPAMQPELVNLANEAIEQMFGLSSIDQGTQGDLRRVSGTVVQSAQMAGNTIVAMFYDSLRRFRKRFGLLNIQFLTNHYTPTQLIRIIGEEFMPDLEALQEATWGDIMQYDIKVEENPTSTVEQMETLSKLQQVGSLDAMRERGDIDFEDYLNLIPTLPEHLKRSMIEKHQYREQAQQQVQSIQLELQKQQAEFQMLQQFMQQTPEGSQAVQKFNQLLAVAEPMAQEIANSQSTNEPGPMGPEGPTA